MYTNNVQTFYFLVTMKCTKLEVKPSFPSPRRGHTASVVGTNIYVFGGYNGISYYNDLFIFDSSKYRALKNNIAIYIY